MIKSAANRKVSFWLEENGGVLLRQCSADKDGRGPWDLPTGDIREGETEVQALERFALDLLKVPCEVGPRLLQLVLTVDGAAQQRAVYKIKLDPRAGVPRPDPSVRMGWDKKSRLGDIASVEFRQVLAALRAVKTAKPPLKPKIGGSSAPAKKK